MLLWILAHVVGAFASPPARAAAPSVDRLPLADALRRLGDQSGLLFIYEQALVSNLRAAAPPLTGTTKARLESVLQGTGLRWRYIDEHTVAIFRPSEEGGAVGAAQPAKVASSGDDGKLLDIDVTATLSRFAGLTTSSLGFPSSLIDAPRSVVVINEEAIDLFALNVVEDLLRLAPGVFTTTRFGIQGSVDVRAVPADSYFRGMKRLTLQGHGRSVLAALDSIEVLAGPPPAIYGLGKFGGFTNVFPKSGRARDGRYLDSMQGFVQGVTGSYDRREVSFGWGGPVSPRLSGNRPGGFYVYGLVEDSGAFTDGLPVKQRLLQAATSVSDIFGRFRLETGISLQESVTAGALVGRLTQDLVDTGAYLGGTPLVNLDLNGNGRIGYLETATASPVLGRLTANNQPLSQVFAWPLDAAGKPLPLEQFPRIAGIPRPMFDYLQAHPEADPLGALRARGVGGPLPISGAVPVGMVLDPRTIRTGTLNMHRSTAYERKLDARFGTFYLDLIDDADPAHTVRNQFFVDAMDQYKSSNQPFSQVQRVLVVEDKLTATRQLAALPWGLAAQALVTANLRGTLSEGRMTLADYGNHRSDALDPLWNPALGGMTPNTTFSSSVEYPQLTDDGLPWASIYRTRYTEAGLGVLFDLRYPRFGTVLALGARYDVSEARNTNYPGRFNYNTGTAQNPGQVLTEIDEAHGWDREPGWSVSVSQPLPGGWQPYVTYARSSILLDGNNNSFANSVINAGHIGSAQLKEVGLKARLRNRTLELSIAAFEQGRLGVHSDDDVNVLNAYASATTSRGWQTELRWTPTPRSLLSFYATQRHTRYAPNVGGVVQLDARALGFQDVLDANGKVIYPAEAFLYGGRARIVLPNDLPQYAEKQGNPSTQLGFSALHQITSSLGYSVRGNYLSSTCSGRLCLVRLPESLVFDAGVFARIGRAELKLDALNLTNVRYFRARTGDTLGDVIAQAMPDRRWQFAVRYSF